MPGLLLMEGGGNPGRREPGPPSRPNRRRFKVMTFRSYSPLACPALMAVKEVTPAGGAQWCRPLSQKKRSRAVRHRMF
jgi:hypothetical protein